MENIQVGLRKQKRQKLQRPSTERGEYRRKKKTLYLRRKVAGLHSSFPVASQNTFKPNKNASLTCELVTPFGQDLRVLAMARETWISLIEAKFTRK